MIGPTGLRGWQGNARQKRDKVAILRSEIGHIGAVTDASGQAYLCVWGRPGKPAAEVPYGLLRPLPGRRDRKAIRANSPAVILDPGW